MTNCPIAVNQHGTRSSCMMDSCAFWSNKENHCLISLALTKYISSNIERDNAVENLKQQMKAVSLGFAPFPPIEEKDWSGLQGGF